MRMRWVVVAGVALALATTGVAVRAEDPPVVGVEALMKNVNEHRGVLRVEGVVSVVSAEHQSLTLIDTRELEECGVTTCAEFKLPVRWKGSMPAVRDVVRVEGEVQEKDGKRVFVATGLEKMPRPVEKTRR